MREPLTRTRLKFPQNGNIRHLAYKYIPLIVKNDIYKKSGRYVIIYWYTILRMGVNYEITRYSRAAQEKHGFTAACASRTAQDGDDSDVDAHRQTCQGACQARRRGQGRHQDRRSGRVYFLACTRERVGQGAENRRDHHYERLQGRRRRDRVGRASNARREHSAARGA